MTCGNRTISLGFTKQQFPPGVHVCQIFSDDHERQEAFLKFIQSGLSAKECTSCFTDEETEQSIEALLKANGVSYKEARTSGAFVFARTSEAYFKDNRFDPDRMLKMLTQSYDESVAHGFPGARVIGEMSPMIQRLPGGSRLLEYEARISLLQRDHPITAVCQYDARLFDGALIMDILKVHPLMVMRGSIVHNPFFIQPEDYWAA